MDDIVLVAEAGYPWAIGGVSSWIADLVAGLPECRFTIVNLRCDEQQQPRPLPPRNARLLDVQVAVPSTTRAVQEKVLGALGNVRPDLVHATSSGLAGMAALEVSRQHNAPLVLTEHGVAWADGRGGRSNRSVIFWQAEALHNAAMLYQQADRITSVSHANTALQQQLVRGRRPIEVIPNGVPPSGGEHGIRPVRPDATVVFAGRISPEKGVDRFIQTAALLARVQPELRFELRGPDDDGPYAARCRALASSLGLDQRLRFVGSVPRAQLFAGADLLIAPSCLEACPYVVLEAMAAGVPVVASAVGDCAQMLQGSGLAVTGGAEQYARAALELLEPAAHQHASRAARTTARSRYALEGMIAGYRELYRSLSQRTGRRSA
jgi:glycosyltransferase involved in cell wall biosynthesis